MLSLAVTSTLLLTTSSCHSYFILAAVLLPAGLSSANSSRPHALGSQYSPRPRNVSSSSSGCPQSPCTTWTLPPEVTPGTERKLGYGRVPSWRWKSPGLESVGGKPPLGSGFLRLIESARKRTGSENEASRRPRSGTLTRRSRSAVRSGRKWLLSRFPGSGNGGSSGKGIVHSGGVTFPEIKGSKGGDRVERRQEMHEDRRDRRREEEEEWDKEDEGVPLRYPMRTLFIGKRDREAERKEERGRGTDRDRERHEVGSRNVGRGSDMVREKDRDGSKQTDRDTNKSGGTNRDRRTSRVTNSNTDTYNHDYNNWSKQVFADSLNY